MGRATAGVVLPLLLVSVWWVASAAHSLPNYLLPPPGLVGRTLVQYCTSGALVRDVGASLLRVGIGVGLGALLGLLVGAVIGWWPKVAPVLEPTVDVLRHVPPLAWVPFALLWFKGGLASAAFIVMLVAFFPVLTATTYAMRSVPQQLVDMARTVGCTRVRMLWSVALPAALPGILSSLRVALGGGWMAVVAAEYFGYRDGLGALAFNAYQVLRTDLLIVAMVVIGIVGFGLDAMIKGVVKRFVWWGGR
jgi:ABC-type nitrate/sulfonate/bicarbonate transport system permease component